ncbi:MAG: hypothetical protein P4L86_16540 [Mycobacterium sp.]|nr:hypothetical protein [Mycobacterium sp.]
MTKMSTSVNDDVIDYVKAQHLMTRALFTKTLHAADVTERQQYFAELRAALTAQEVAEELHVHPRVRNPESAEFETALTDLQQATRDHTQRVEIEEFPLLSEA